MPEKTQLDFRPLNERVASAQELLGLLQQHPLAHSLHDELIKLEGVVNELHELLEMMEADAQTAAGLDSDSGK
jgi:hypothetical protein